MESEWGEEWLDSETGEKRNVGVPRGEPPTDAETGEPEVHKRTRRNRFRVPRRNWQELQQQEKSGRTPKNRKRTYHGSHWRKQEIRSNVVREFFLGNGMVTSIVVLLPTLFIFSAWGSLLCLFGEVYMHIWSHKRNWTRKNVNVEYRSPFHLISCNFCVYCRLRKWKEKIGQIQDERNLRRNVQVGGNRPTTCHNVDRRRGRKINVAATCSF